MLTPEDMRVSRLPALWVGVLTAPHGSAWLGWEVLRLRRAGKKLRDVACLLDRHASHLSSLSQRAEYEERCTLLAERYGLERQGGMTARGAGALARWAQRSGLRTPGEAARALGKVREVHGMHPSELELARGLTRRLADALELLGAAT